MDTTELKKITKEFVDDIDKRLDVIESNVRKRNSWKKLHESIKNSPGQADVNVLTLMNSLFGEHCLKSLIIDVSEKYIKEFDEKIVSQSCDLKMIVNRK